LTEIYEKNRYNGQRGNCNVSVGRYNNNNSLLHHSTLVVQCCIKGDSPSYSGPHKCNTTTIQLQHKNFFLYCSCIALVRTPAIQRCNTSFLQVAGYLQQL